MDEEPFNEEPFNEDQFIEKWFAYWKLSRRERNKDFDTYVESWQLDQMVDNDPVTAWDLIQKLVEKAPTDSLLALIAAGPLENLLWKHGPEFIDDVEITARQNPKFRKCLRAVWGANSMKPEIWKRVDKACGSEPKY